MIFMILIRKKILNKFIKTMKIKRKWLTLWQGIHVECRTPIK